MPDKSQYQWRNVHDDLLKDNFAGVYGWDNAAYWCIAEKKAKVELSEFYKKRTADEFYLPEWKALLDNPETQAHWGQIATFDPLGLYGMPPTIASCKAQLTIPELVDLPRDGKIVDSEGQIQVSKAAVCYAWNVPMLAQKLGLSEAELRDALCKSGGGNPKIKEPGVNTFIPAVGGFTIYAFGDVRKIRDPTTEIAVRVHDECIGSDVFGSDICTCRPYLIFALRHAVECAQRGGVGIVVYFRKEGRSLGEVVKFRVYNARCNQPGGDSSDKYFYHTESIAGIRDARFQQMMPDALLWLGISRIDWLLSMSNDKYEAITQAGIKVMQRVSLPDNYVPKSAWVELEAKIASGYHSENIDRSALIDELSTLDAVRSRCRKVYDTCKRKSCHFVIHEEKIQSCADYVVKVIRAKYPDLNIPPHSRLRHFSNSVLATTMERWPVSIVERTRRLVDVCTVSVLMDAGAGAAWHYIDPRDGRTVNRSEGIALASFNMFENGVFSSDTAVKCRVNSLALVDLKVDDMKRGLQVRNDNPIVGVEGRVDILRKLGQEMEKFPQYFGGDDCEVFRPGHIVDYVLKNAVQVNEGGQIGYRVSATLLFDALIKGLQGVWPVTYSGSVRRGDIWLYSRLKKPSEPGSDFVPFHKLTQWLTYTLMDAMSSYLRVKFTDEDKLTCLAEYRNGGLLIDTGVLSLHDASMAAISHAPGSELVVEWRALTVVLMDKVAGCIRDALHRPDMPLSSILEGGTWRAGRELAYNLRKDGSPPLALDLDGTVF